RPRQRPSIAPSAQDPTEVDWKDPRSLDEVPAPQPARIGRQPVRPFQPQPLQRLGRALLVARQEFEPGTDAQYDAACARHLSRFVRDHFLLGGAYRDEAEPGLCRGEE